MLTGTVPLKCLLVVHQISQESFVAVFWLSQLAVC